jgi:DNA-binding NtrC family response regulator
VDDEEEFLASMARALTRRGFGVATARGGLEALAALREGDVDVAVVDVKMPGMDGIELLSRIKRDSPAVEVILLTGHATVDLAIQGMKQGAFDFLFKPHEPDDLAAKIRIAAGRRKP